jgi:NAD+ synthase
LDDILRGLVEAELPVAELVARGHSVETVKKVERLLYLAEYKRRQAAPGVKISSRHFGRDRRYPITNKFRDEILSAAEEPKVKHVVKPVATGSEG